MSALAEEIELAVRKVVREELARAGLEGLAAKVEAVHGALPPSFLSIREAASRMGVSEKTARRRVKEGLWPSRRDGGRVLVDLSAMKPMNTDEVAREAQRLRALPGGK